jgi:hypothetical protein
MIKTAILYDQNSRDSLAAAMLYQMYIDYASLNSDTLIPYDGHEITQLVVDPQTAIAYDRYIFLEIPPDANTLSLMVANNRTVYVFAYVQPLGWQQQTGINLVLTSPLYTIAAMFMNWLYPDVDSYSFTKYIGDGLPNIINNWETYCKYYMDANSLRHNFVRDANWLSYMLKTNTFLNSKFDTKSIFIGELNYKSLLANAGNAFQGMWQQDITDGDNIFHIKKMNLPIDSVQETDRIMTHHYFGPFIQQTDTYVEYYEISVDQNGNPILSICLKPVAFVLSPIFLRDTQSLQSLLGLDTYNAILTIVSDYYLPLGVTNNKFNWDGSYSFNLPIDKYFPTPELG